MDTVPTGAAALLAFIRETETGRADRSAYDTIYAHKESKLPKPLTSMTLGEIIDAQRKWSKNYGSSAAGAYQFMRATLIDLSKEINLRGDQIFFPTFQDLLGFHLLKRRGYEAWAAGKIGDTEFAKRLAMEWASFPVLVPTKGAHRTVQRGETYYAGDKLNKALVSPEKIEALLARVKNGQEPAKDARKPVPAPKQPETPEPAPAAPHGGIAAALVLFVAALGVLWAWAMGMIDHAWTFIERIF